MYSSILGCTGSWTATQVYFVSYKLRICPTWQTCEQAAVDKVSEMMDRLVDEWTAYHINDYRVAAWMSTCLLRRGATRHRIFSNSRWRVQVLADTNVNFYSPCRHAFLLYIKLSNWSADHGFKIAQMGSKCSIKKILLLIKHHWHTAIGANKQT